MSTVSDCVAVPEIACRIGDESSHVSACHRRRVVAVTFHAPPIWTRAVNVCPATVTVTIVPAGTASLVPEIVGVGSFVKRGRTTSDRHVGDFVSTVSDCVALPVFPAGSVTEATRYVAVEQCAAVTAHVPAP